MRKTESFLHGSACCIPTNRGSSQSVGRPSTASLLQPATARLDGLIRHDLQLAPPVQICKELQPG